MPIKLPAVVERHIDSCPLDLTNPIALYQQLKSYLNGLGQMDGYWSAAGNLAIPVAYPETELSVAVQEAVAPGYLFRASRYVANHHLDLIPEFRAALIEQTGFEFAKGWRIFPVRTTEDHCFTEWFVSGMLFPPYQNQVEGWVIIAHVGEVFG